MINCLLFKMFLPIQKIPLAKKEKKSRGGIICKSHIYKYQPINFSTFITNSRSNRRSKINLMDRVKNAVFYGKYNQFNPLRPGGLESWARRMGCYLYQRGIAVDYVLYGAPEVGRKQVNIDGCTFNLHCFLKARQAALFTVEADYDFIQMQSFPARGWQAFKKAKKKGSRLVRTHFFFKDDYRRRRLTYRYYESFFHKTFAISPRIVKGMAENNLQSTLILPPVSPQYFAVPEDKKKKNQLTVSFLGRIAPEKGIGRIFEVFSLLDARYQGKVKTQIIGYSFPHRPDSTVWHSILKAQKHITYIPSDLEEPISSEKKLRDYLLSSDIVLLPYTSLANTLDMPLLFLEAIAALAIVVTTEVGSIKSLAPNPDLVLDKDVSAKELYKTLTDLIEGDIEAERQKVYKKRQDLPIHLDEVGETYLQAIMGKKKAQNL